MVIPRIRRSAATVLASLTALSGVIAPAVFAPAAHADERNIVIFGDSIVSDPTAGMISRSRRMPDERGPANINTWCPQSETNWGRRAAAKLGLVPRDYSCTGVTTISRGPQFSVEVDRAVRDAALNPGTERIIITTGFNDTYNNEGRPDADVRRDFVNYMVPQVQRMREAAPNARIQFVGYPTIMSGDRVCLFHVFPNASDWTSFVQAQKWENQAQWMLVDAAQASGAEFLDLKPSTADNGMCAPDAQRMWAGLVDFHGGPRNLPVHVNQRGHEHVANVIAAS